MALIPVFYTASTKDIAEKSHEQGILKYPGICWIQDIETIVYVSSDNELHYAKGNEQIDKVIGAVSGHLPTLNDDGSLVDSGKSVNDFETAGAAASVLADAKSYINKKISELINGAPETADTLKELSDLVSQNKDVITSLDTLVSKKADITAIPTTLPNPNALTFSGLVEGNYDGSEAVDIEVPQDMWIHVTIDSSYSHISERDTTFEEIDNYYTSHPNNNIFMSCLINNIECIGTLETASPGNSYTFGVMSCPTADATVNGITKKSITIYENDGYGIDDNILSIPYVRVSGDITFERAVCELLAKADIGYVTTSDKYYLVIKTNFDRGRGGCLVYDEHEAFKLYSYTLMNGEEWTITPTSSPNIISITRCNHGAYKSSYNFNTIKKINPENMLVCYNDAYGRLVSMDDNKVVFNIPKYVDNHLSIYMTIITINSDNSVEVIMEVPFARLLKNDNDAYVLDLSDIFMGDQFDIVYIDDAIKSTYLGKMYKETDDGAIFRIWLSETEIMDVTLDYNSMNDDTDLSAVPVTVEKKSIVPAALPNPNKLTLSGLVSAEYDGSSDVSVEIPEPYPYFTIGSDTAFAEAVCKITQSYKFGFIYDSRLDTTYTVIRINFSKGTGIAYVSDLNSGFVKYFTNSQTNTITKSTDVIRNPNPNKLILTGSIEAEYDGSSEVSVDIPPADLVVTVTATSNDEYQSDTTFEQIRNASGDVRLICKSGTGEPDVYGNLILLSSSGAIFKITLDPSDTGYIIIDPENAVHIEHYRDIYAVQISKLNNNKYTCNNTTFEDLLEIINITSNVVVTYNGYVGYLETQPTSEATVIAFNIIKDDAIIRILIDNTNNVTVKETPLGSNSFIVKITSISSNGTYDSDHSFNEIKEAYDKGLNPIAIYGNLICQIVYIDMYTAEFINYSNLNNGNDSCKIIIDKSGTTFQTLTLITSNEVIPDLDRVLDTMDPIYPSTYPVSAQAIGKLRDSIKESIPTKLSQLESRDYNSLENKPIVSINDLLSLDSEHFMHLDGKVDDKGVTSYRTYKFIVDPSLDLNNKLIVVTSDNNIKSMSLAVMAKDSAETTKVYAAIFNLGIGELIAISTDKIHKTATVCRLSVGYRISLMFNDDGYVERTVVSSVANKSDVLTKTNKTEFIPTEDYHPATKKYVDDTCGEYSPTVRIEKTASDTTVELEPNKLYVFPEMLSLTYTLATPSDTSIANEYHFIFQSGATATELVHPANVSVPDGFAVEKNKVYEISILEGCLAYQSWAVS